MSVSVSETMLCLRHFEPTRNSLPWHTFDRFRYIGVDSWIPFNSEVLVKPKDPLLKRLAPEQLTPRVRRKAFIKALSLTGNYSRACEAAGIRPSRYQSWRRKDPTFAAAMSAAMEEAADTLEQEAVRRARDGVRKGIYHQGKRVATELVYSDTLLTFLLKGLRRRAYGDRLAHSGADGDNSPIKFTLTIDRPHGPKSDPVLDELEESA